MPAKTMLDNAIIRDILKHFLKSSTALDAFCVDHFPVLFKRFSSAMDTEQKFNIMLMEVSQQEILSAIKRNFEPEVIEKVIQGSLDNMKRKANPSLLYRLRWYGSRNKLIFFSLIALLVISFWGDPVAWRQRIVPRIKAFFITDPIVVLEEAWEEFDHKNYDSALEKARCIMFMHSSNDKQKRQASLLISYITEAKAKEVVDHALARSLSDNASLKLNKRATELAAKRHLGLSAAFDVPPKEGEQRSLSNGNIVATLEPQSPAVDFENMQKNFDSVKEQAARAENQLATVSNEREHLRWQIRNMQLMLGSMKSEFDHTLSALSGSERRLDMASFRHNQMNEQSADMQSLLWQMKTELHSIISRLEKTGRDHNQLLMQINFIQAQLYASAINRTVPKVAKTQRSRDLSKESEKLDSDVE